MTQNWTENQWFYEVINPPRSPDFNIIEAVWDHLDRERDKRQPTSKGEL